MRPIKNSNVESSPFATSFDPYQKISAITNIANDWDRAYKPLLQIAVRFDLRKGSSRLAL